MRNTMSLIILAAIVAAGLYFSPIVGLALLVGAIVAVVLTARRYGSVGQSPLDDVEVEVDPTYELNDHVGFYAMDNCECGNRKMASSPQCYPCSQMKG